MRKTIVSATIAVVAAVSFAAPSYACYDSYGYGSPYGYDNYGYGSPYYGGGYGGYGYGSSYYGGYGSPGGWASSSTVSIPTCVASASRTCCAVQKR